MVRSLPPNISPAGITNHPSGCLIRGDAPGSARVIPAALMIDPLAPAPRHAGRRPGIHALPYCDRHSRGCRAFARHDDGTLDGESIISAHGIIYAIAEGAATAHALSLHHCATCAWVVNQRKHLAFSELHDRAVVHLEHARAQLTEAEETEAESCAPHWREVFGAPE